MSQKNGTLEPALRASEYKAIALANEAIPACREKRFKFARAVTSKGETVVKFDCQNHPQGGVTGYAHSASGMQIDGRSAVDRLLREGDRNGNGVLDRDEASRLFLPADFEELDRDADQHLSRQELLAAHVVQAERLPNYAIPAMNGVGAMEIFVSTVHGVCDFISAMDTARIQEWNTWHHLLNCGFPLKVSGETDFPQLHTNPVTVLVAGKPIRASRRSALWCFEATRLLWENRHRAIDPSERDEAEKAFQRAMAKYQEIADEVEE